MITRIHSTAVTVSDQEAAKALYVDALGFELCADQLVEGERAMRWLTVRPAGSQTELALIDQKVMGSEAPSRQTGIAFVAADIDATYATLSERGVRFKHPVADMPWGDRATWFYDPDGNEFFLVSES